MADLESDPGKRICHCHETEPFRSKIHNQSINVAQEEQSTDKRYKEQRSYGKSSPTSSSDAKMTILDKSENHGAGWAAAAPGYTGIQVFQLVREELLRTPWFLQSLSVIYRYSQVWFIGWSPAEPGSFPCATRVPLTCFSFPLGDQGALDCDLARAVKWAAAAKVSVVVVVIFLTVERTQHPSGER